MEAQVKPNARARRTLRRPEPEVSTAGKLAIYLTVAAMAGVLVLVGLLVVRSTGRGRQAIQVAKPSSYARPKPPPEPKVMVSPEQEKREQEEWLKQYLPPESPTTGRRTLRQRIEAEYEAAKRRSELYAGQGRWGDAIAALERVMDRYDDEELRLRVDPEVVELRRQVNRAFKNKMAEAEKLMEAGRFPEARKTLEGIVAFGIEDFTAQAREKLKQIAEREDADAAAHFAKAMAAVDAKLPSWQFEEALAEAKKLHFDRPYYKELQARRIARIQALLDLKKKIIERIIRGGPRLSKRALGVPGSPGELTVADADFLYSIGPAGEEKVPWGRLGPEATARLALAAGRENDPNHSLAVARLLLELGHLDRARQELERARALGAATADEEAELAARGKTTPPPKRGSSP